MTFAPTFQRVFRGTFDRAGAGITWLLRDDFNDTLAAGSVNGTPATPGPGTRTVVDTNSKLSVGGGVLSVITGGIAAGDPQNYYGIQNRVLGKLLSISITTGTDARSGQVGFDSNDVAETYESILFGNLNVLFAYSGATLINSIGTWAVSTAYKVAVVMRSTGAYLFLKTTTGAWKLMWVGSVGAGNMYPKMTNIATNDAYTSDFIRIPTNLWLPTALAYDTFGRADGALGSTETVGPDGSAAPALPVTARAWTGATWTIATGKAINTPTTFGGDVVTNGNFAAWTGDNPDNWTLSIAEDANNYVTEATGKARYVGATGGLLTVSQNCTPITGFYKCSANIVAIAYGRITMQGIVGGLYGGYTTTGVKTFSGLCSVGIRFWAETVASDVTIDDITVQLMTTSELISSVSVGASNTLVMANIVAIPMTWCGMIAKLDSTSSPANYILAVLRNTSPGTSVNVLTVFKFVGGVGTTLINAGIIYSASARLEIHCDGTAVRVYYNNALVGTEQTVSDAGIVSNTLHGLFSTDPSNTFDDFLVMPRGNGGEYAALDAYIA